jgi:hypothetical protein
MERVAERMLSPGRPLASGHPHPDFGESTRERAERLHRLVRMETVTQPEDGLRGA